jgi:hypothetical protein
LPQLGQNESVKHSHKDFYGKQAIEEGESVRGILSEKLGEMDGQLALALVDRAEHVKLSD